MSGAVQRVSRGSEGKRHKRLLVSFTADEYAQVKEAADVANMPVAVMLRLLALDYEPKPVIDVEQVREVIRARGDLGRLGGLLKLWLTEQPGRGADAAEVRRILNQIEDAAEDVKQKVLQL